jgi:hypothetical protein
MSNKLGVIVPYRNREEHLTIFKEHITNYLNKKNINFELIIVEQFDDKPFNRGKLLNIGFIEAKRLECNYVVFHDVDMLPIDVDYSYSNFPTHLATNFDSDSNVVFETYFGGVTMFPTHLFEKTNGYSNEYWGWGFEDDALFKRCIDVGLDTDYKVYNNPIQSKNALQFFGKDSYVKLNNIIDFKKSIKISTTFNVNKIINPNKEYDEYTIFSIPGYDLTLTYNSFGRYKFEIWDYKYVVYSITSEILPPKPTNIKIEINPCECNIRMIQDGVLIDSIEYNRKLRKYESEPYIYLGNANPYRGTNFKEFYGYISDFRVRNDGESIIDLNFDNYQWPHIKNKNNEIIGEVFDCEKRKILESNHTILPIPNRRKGLFNLLEHTSNGFKDGKWMNKETRDNQIMYSKNLDNSGLNNVEYKLIEKTNNHIKVKL